jgi:hypothetical protein
MVRRQNAPLRPVTADERAALERIVRASSERADRVARAKALLAVADGAAFTVAARTAGRRSGEAVGRLVARFNREGVAAVEPGHGGGATVQYGPAERARILREVRRAPDREQDRTATWSLTTLQRALQRAPDGLPGISTWTILQTLWDAGYGWQRSRTWCPTGTALRARKAGVVEVTDPDAAPKQTRSSRRTSSPKGSASRSGPRTRPVRTRRSRSRGRPGSPRATRPASRTSTSAGAPPSC